LVLAVPVLVLVIAVESAKEESEAVNGDLRERIRRASAIEVAMMMKGGWSLKSKEAYLLSYFNN
jgi:hypothetical protein